MAEAKRTLAAILAADVVGYSRLMGDDERATMDMLNICRDVFRKHISDHEGRVVDTTGDSVVATFPSVVEAVECAVEVQNDLRERNADLPEGRQMLFRIGVNVGDIIEQTDGTVYGDGVNVAARLESLSGPGGVCLSETAYMQIEGKIDLAFDEIGEHKVKNIARPIKVFAWRGVDRSAAAPTEPAVIEGSKPTVAIGAFEALGQSGDISVLAGGVRAAVGVSLSNQTGIAMLSDPAMADYIVTARLQGLGDRYRTTVQVLDRRSNEQFASERFDGEITDLFQAQDELAYRIYTSIRYAVYDREGSRSDDRAIADKPSETLLAQASFLLFQHQHSKYARAQEMLQTVIDRDPADFMALAMMSYCRLTEVVCGYREIRDTVGAAALDFARRAVRLNEKSDFAHSSLCHALLYCDRDFDTAEREASRSLELNPSFALSMYQLGEVRIFHDRVENGIDLCLKAVDANKWGLANHWIMRVIAIGQFVLVAPHRGYDGLP